MTALTLLGYIVVAFGLQILLATGVAISRRKPAAGVQPVQTTPPKAAWQGLRDFRVTWRAYEDVAQTQCSFTLAPLDAIALPPFQPGQFLTLSLAVEGADASARVVRCYSLSDTSDPARFRITVKRRRPRTKLPGLPRAGCTMRHRSGRFCKSGRRRGSLFS